MRDRRLLRRVTDGELRLHADLSQLCAWHANDMVVAADGSAYVGNFGFDLGNEPPRAAALVRVAPDGSSAACVTGGLRFPNGVVIADDGRTLVVAETWASRLTAFTIEMDARSRVVAPGPSYRGRRRTDARSTRRDACGSQTRAVTGASAPPRAARSSKS
jgi:sugar lactone lactonase YvrE